MKPFFCNTKSWARASISCMLIILLTACFSPTVHQKTEKSVKSKLNLPRLNFLTFADGQLAYRDTGFTSKANINVKEKETVFLLHPMTGSSESWRKQYSYLSSSGFRVIGVSLRGAGESGQLPSLEHKDNDDLLALLDHLSIAQVHVVGAAAGAISGLRFTIEYPGRVKSLVISNSYAGLTANELINLNKNFLPKPGLSAQFKELGPSYRYTAFQKGASELEEWEQVYQNSRSYKLSQLEENLRKKRFLNILKQLTSIDEISQIKHPVLLIYGGSDLLMPPPIGEMVSARFNMAEMVVIPLAGHAAHWEFPLIFNDVLTDFLHRVN